MTTGTDGAVVHRYRSSLAWSGTTGVGYEDYDRRHETRIEPCGTELPMSSDPAFRGDPSLTNPEQLLLLSASSCQLLSFLAVAARARLDVVAYTDEASAEMPEDQRPVRITSITLRPRVELRGAPDADREALAARVRHLLDVAHRECFIANTLTAEMTIDPEIIIT